MDDEKILFQGRLAWHKPHPKRQDAVVLEYIHVRAGEYLDPSGRTAMVGIQITRGDGRRQRVDVTRERYDEFGLDKFLRQVVEKDYKPPKKEENKADRFGIAERTRRMFGEKSGGEQ